MPATASKCLLPPLPPIDNVGEHHRGGIVSILDCSNNSQSTRSSALRRTLSAGLSSEKLKNDQPPSSASPPTMKRVGSHQELTATRSSWSSILSSDPRIPSSSDGLPPPIYVPPAVRRSSSSLSVRSLEICTESLGSETGSDGPLSFSSDEGSDCEQNQEFQQRQKEDRELERKEIVRFVGEIPRNRSKNPSVRVRPFPPAIPSLRMRSSRREGRLVLEAVSLPRESCFRQQRRQGRLLLTLAASTHDDDDSDEDDNEEESSCQDEDSKLEVFEDDDEDKEKGGNLVYMRAGRMEESGEMKTKGEEQQMVNALLLGCKETTRVQEIWKPCCIASS